MSKPKVIYMHMTDERKEQWKRASSDIIDLLRREFPDSPIEAAAVLQFIMEGFHNMYGIDEDTFVMKERMQ